ELSREISAQCSCFIDIAGKLPDHLDAHHHTIYRHPAALRTTLDLAVQHQIPVRNPGFGASLPDLLAGLPETSRTTSEAKMRTSWDATAPGWPDHFEAGFYDETATLGDLLLILANLREGVTELMSHPAYTDDPLLLRSDYTLKREAELAAL